MTDQRTMRTFLDLVTERDEALGEATRLADLLAVVGQTCDEVDRGRLLLIPALRRIWAAARTPESGPLAAERPDPFAANSGGDS